MPLKLLSAPVEEPLRLAEAKQHLRIDYDDDDDLIMGLIGAARACAETETQRQLVTATWRYLADSFPGPSLTGVPWGTTYSHPAHAILLSKSPVQSVTQITYLDMAGVRQVLSPAVYTVPDDDDLTRITPVFGQIWPPCLPQIGCVQVDFVAGYGTADDVPQGLKSWMKLLVGAMHENRELATTVQRGAVVEMPWAGSLLDPFRVVRL
jgi:uncharacterized phiE125 gp8 family phage protein